MKRAAKKATKETAAYHSQAGQDVLRELAVETEQGLTAAEVARRQEKYGANKLAEKKGKSRLVRFLEQFRDPIIVILIVAAVVSYVVAAAGNEPTEFLEPLLILLIVVLNAVVGTIQEGKAEKALEALKHVSPPHARVVRDGAEKVIDAAELVPGDIIRLEAGDFVPADARLLSSAGLESEESALTGESVPSTKDAQAVLEAKTPLGDRSNMVFSGCSVTHGTAKAVVVATGMQTEVGKIAGLLEGEEEQQTPLQRRLAKLGKNLSLLALAACVVIFVVGASSGMPILKIFMTAVSLAVSAIPEGLPVIVTIVLSIGVQRMVQKNALIHHLPAVESLGCASVICSDKTGTLTQNRMTLVKVYLDGDKAAREVQEKNPAEVRKLLRYGALCCDGSVTVHGKEVQQIGDPTETAIIWAAQRDGMAQEDLEKRYPRLAEIPFDSDRKLMATVNKVEGKNVVIVKGAFDVMAPLCTSGDLEAARKMTEQMSAEALRVLAVGYKEIERVPEKPTAEKLESGLRLLGLVGMIDPPRAEAKAAIATCRRAGIKPVMITGDHVVTASAIAQQLGILHDKTEAITGAELDAMDETQFDGVVEKVSVYARVSPEDKIRIVKAWQRKGHVVAMTGDGVNDAPALKAADIGCAMGITGTDVAKGAADMILTDDNFVTIVDAVREGRGIYANIRKVVSFLLGTNIGEVLTVFVAMLLWHQSPLTSMQLLWVNLVTDSLPAIALGMEAVEPDVMNKKPKPRDEGIFAHGLGVRVALQGCLFAVLSLLGFLIGESATGVPEGGQTMAFIVLTMSQLAQAYSMRSERSLFKIGPFSNHKLNWACLIAAGMVVAVLFTPLCTAFGMMILPGEMYLVGLGLALVPLVVLELAKLGRREGRREKAGGR